MSTKHNQSCPAAIVSLSLNTASAWHCFNSEGQTYIYKEVSGDFSFCMKENTIENIKKNYKKNIVLNFIVSDFFLVVRLPL